MEESSRMTSSTLCNRGTIGAPGSPSSSCSLISTIGQWHRFCRSSLMRSTKSWIMLIGPGDPLRQLTFHVQGLSSKLDSCCRPAGVTDRNWADVRLEIIGSVVFRVARAFFQTNTIIPLLLGYLHQLSNEYGPFVVDTPSRNVFSRFGFTL